MEILGEATASFASLWLRACNAQRSCPVRLSFGIRLALDPSTSLVMQDINVFTVQWLILVSKYCNGVQKVPIRKGCN